MEFRMVPRVLWSFIAKEQSSGSYENEMNRKSKKYSQKNVGILYNSFRVAVSV